jgi:hypothetical protein
MGEFVRVIGTTDVKPGHGIVAEVNGKTMRFLIWMGPSMQSTMPVSMDRGA